LARDHDITVKPAHVPAKAHCRLGEDAPAALILAAGPQRQLQPSPEFDPIEVEARRNGNRPTPLNKLDRTLLRQWVADLVDPEESGLAPATTTKVVQVLNKCVRAALDDRLIAINPVERLPLPKVEREEMRFLTHAELARLVDVIDHCYRAFGLLGG
jgi:hypothetical protein